MNEALVSSEFKGSDPEAFRGHILYTLENQEIHQMALVDLTKQLRALIDSNQSVKVMGYDLGAIERAIDDLEREVRLQTSLSVEELNRALKGLNTITLVVSDDDEVEMRMQVEEFISGDELGTIYPVAGGVIARDYLIEWADNATN